RVVALRAVDRFGRSNDVAVELDELVQELPTPGAECEVHWNLLDRETLLFGSVSDTPLAGLRVLELGPFIAGPFAGQLLGDLGADVIKIEPPGVGDIMRRYGVRVDGRSLWWPAIARNKRSVAIDLRDERGRAAARRIAAHCDVVLENFKPGTLAGWGLDYATLSAD